MRKLLIAIVGCFCFLSNSIAQDKALIVQGTSPDLYLSHTVTPKENYYSIGRLYNVSPKELAPYNNLQFDKGLSLGQTIKIPLTQNNFSQGDAATTNEVLVPVYHVVQAKEGLYRVSVSYNKVPLDVLKKWNKLPGDVVSNGTKLIVGYLKVDKDQSAFAKSSGAVKTMDVVLEKKEQVIPPPAPPKTNSSSPKETVIKDAEKEKVQQPVKEQTKEPVKETKTVETKNESITTSNNPSVNFAGGFFKKLYSNQTDNRSVVTESGTAAVFKTTSGWQDGKYYCFHNQAQPGTIIKITNNATGKSIYAKVLDAIPDIKQNEGLLLRVSNAAAEELGATETKFDCSISYSK